MNIIWFKDFSYKNKNLVGGKNSSLGELYHLSKKLNFKLKICFHEHFNFLKIILCKMVSKYHKYERYQNF